MRVDGDGADERFTVSISLREDFILAQAAGELDYGSADLLHRQIIDAWAATPSRRPGW